MNDSISRKILVVEDEAPKRRHLTSCVNASRSQVDIYEATSVTSALIEIENHDFDLIVLDVSLPTFSVSETENGGRPQAFGGLEVLRTLLLFEKKMPVIIVTGFEAFERNGQMVDLDELRDELTVEFEGILHGVVHFNSSLDKWKHELESCISKYLAE